MVEIAKAETAVCFRDRDAMQAERAHGRPEFDRETIILIDVRSDRGDALAGKARRRVADHVRRFAKPEVQFGHGASSAISDHANRKAGQICSAWPSALSAASCRASPRVGWA